MSGATLTETEKERIADTVASYIMGFEMVMSDYDLDVDEIEEIMLDQGFAKCDECDQYDEAGAMIENIDGSYTHEVCP